MYTIKDSDWRVFADGGDCVHVSINDGVDISDQELLILSDIRSQMVKLKLTDREINICALTDKPMFAQIGHSVKYINGSGRQFYDDVLKIVQN